MAVPTVTTQPVTNISHAGALGHGTITNTGGANATARGIEANPVTTLSSGELPGLVGDGAVVSGGYIYMVCRTVAGGHHVFKVDTSDYSYIFEDPLWFGGGDAICVAGGFLWVGGTGALGGVVLKLSLVDLSTIDEIPVFAGAENITAICSDGTYIYCGCDGAGHWASLKISDDSVIEGVDTLPGWYIHSMCVDGGYLYGSAENILETYSKAFKVDAATLTLDISVNANSTHADDIAQDATYFYVIGSAPPPNSEITRFRKADLDETNLSVTDMRSGDGLALIDGLLIAGWGQYAAYPVNWLWIADQATFTEYNRVAISGDNNRAVNNVLVDGDYIHVQQFRGTGTRGIYFNKYNKADILTDLIIIREAGDFGIGAFMEVIAGLTPVTDYRVKAYAQNPDGYGYGGGVDFSTTAIIAIRQGGHNAAILVAPGLI